MGRHFRRGMIAAVVLTIAAGGLALRLHSQTSSGIVDPDIDARREQLDQRIADARQAGQLRGLVYMALLDQQHRLLVHQRRAEANGMSASDRRDLLNEIARAGANIDKHLGK